MITVATKVRKSDRAIIDDLAARIETAKMQQPTRPTVKQIETIVNDLQAGKSLADTGSKMQQPTMDGGEQFVLDIVATFGTWLAHSVGRADVDYIYATSQQELFEPALNGVIIPEGYEPTGRYRRDLDKAITTIVHHSPDIDVITRYAARTYTTRQSQLGYPVIAGVWGFATRGRLEGIDLVSEDLVFQAQVIASFELLDVSRENAIKALTDILGQQTPSPEEVLACCDRAFWLDEAGFAPLRRAAEAAKTTVIAGDMLTRELATLQRKVQMHAKKYFPEQISNLTLGQVRRICTNAGIAVDPENRTEEYEIRATLKAMGFGGDADRLVSEALRCANSGRLDGFWAIMQAREEGDTSWAEQLNDLSRLDA